MQAQPFDQNLSRKVLSDHAEIAVQPPSREFMSAWNISNPEYHPRFGDKPAFKNTHLFVPNPYSSHDGVTDTLEPSLEEKIETQVESTCCGIIGGAPLLVIIEGFTDFYRRVHQYFKDTEFKDYTMILAPEEGPRKNRTGIIVNTMRLPVIESGVIQTEYVAEEDGGQKKKFVAPHVLLQNGIRVVGVHLNGCLEQHPVSAIKELEKALNSFGNAKIIAMGDFNTGPVNVRHLGFEVLVPDYPTHVNPFCEICYYDYVLVRGIEGCKMEKVDSMTDSTQHLVKEILAARI